MELGGYMPCRIVADDVFLFLSIVHLSEIVGLARAGGAVNPRSCGLLAAL